MGGASNVAALYCATVYGTTALGQFFGSASIVRAAMCCAICATDVAWLHVLPGTGSHQRVHIDTGTVMRRPRLKSAEHCLQKRRMVLNPLSCTVLCRPCFPHKAFRGADHKYHGLHATSPGHPCHQRSLVLVATKTAPIRRLLRTVAFMYSHKTRVPCYLRFKRCLCCTACDKVCGEGNRQNIGWY